MNKQESPTEESLKIIQEMIGQAKKYMVQKISFHFLIWGVVAIIANLSQYILRQVKYDYPYMVWILAFPAALVSWLYAVRQSRKAQAIGHLDRMCGKIWFSFVICLIIVIVFMSKLGVNHNTLILLLAGSSTYLTGVLLKFSPLLYGGVLLWLSGAGGFFLTPQHQNLLSSISIFFGYLVPSIILKRSEISGKV